jgi:hypothetical protein
MLYKGPEERNTHNVDSRGSSLQTRVNHQLYFVQCLKEYVAVTALDCAKSPGARAITLVQMSFADCDIWIALAGDRVTFLEAN